MNMKKIKLLSIVAFLLCSCGTPKEYEIKFESLSFGALWGTIDTHLFEEKVSVVNKLDLSECVVKVLTADKFDVDEYKESVKWAAYNAASMSDEPPVIEEFENKGDLVVPSGTGNLTVYNSVGRKVIELSYLNEKLYHIKLYMDDILLYEAEGIFETRSVEAAPSYVFMSGRTYMKSETDKY